jgi:hypothetical protein
MNLVWLIPMAVVAAGVYLGTLIFLVEAPVKKITAVAAVTITSVVILFVPIYSVDPLTASRSVLFPVFMASVAANMAILTVAISRVTEKK